jgi:hypothetical protein
MGYRPLVLLVLALATVAGAAHALAGAKATSPGTAAAAAVDGQSGLRVHARVRGLLYPGVRRPLVLRVSNPAGRRAVVLRARVRVRRASRGCPRGSLRLQRFRGKLHVRPRGRRTLRLRARMKRTAPDACQGAGYRLRVRTRVWRRERP